MVENAFKWELWRMRGKVWVRSLWVLVVGKAQVGVIGHKSPTWRTRYMRAEAVLILE